MQPFPIDILIGQLHYKQNKVKKVNVILWSTTTIGASAGADVWFLGRQPASDVVAE